MLDLNKGLFGACFRFKVYCKSLLGNMRGNHTGPLKSVGIGMPHAPLTRLFCRNSVRRNGMPRSHHANYRANYEEYTDFCNNDNYPIVTSLHINPQLGNRVKNDGPQEESLSPLPERGVLPLTIYTNKTPNSKHCDENFEDKDYKSSTLYGF